MRKAKMRFWCNINKTLRGRMNFEVRLLQQATKIEPKSIQKCMFLGSAISEAFWKDFGAVLGGQNRRFSQFYREKMEAKNKKISGRQKNRILRQKSGLTPNFWVGLAVRADPGEGIKGWGDAFGAGILGFSFEAVLRGRQIADERLNVWHARLSLQEAADVLRTYRRAAGWV